MLTTKQLAHNTIIQTVGKAVSMCLGVISIALLTHTLRDTGFGVYSIAVTYLQIFGVLVDGGLTLTLVVMLSKPGADDRAIVGTLFFIRMVTAVLLFGGGAAAVWVFPYPDLVKWAVSLGSISYVFMSGASLLVGVFQKQGVMWRAVVGEVLNRLVLCLGIFVMAFLPLAVDTKVMGAMGVMIIANVAWFVSSWVLTRPFGGVHLHWDVALAKRAMRLAAPLALSILFNLIYLRGDAFFLSLLLPEEIRTTHTGFYNLAYRVIDVLTVFPTMFMGLLLPALVADAAAKRFTEFGKHMQRGFDLFCLLGLPLVFGAQVLGTPLILALSGQAFAPAGPVLSLLMMAVLGIFFGALYGHAVVAVEKQGTMLWGYGGVALLTVVGYVFAIPAYGMTGAAVMTIVSEMLVALLTFLVVYRTTGTYPRLVVFAKALLASLGMYGVLTYLPTTPFLLALIVGVLVYVLLLTVLRAVPLSVLRDVFSNRLAKHT